MEVRAIFAARTEHPFCTVSLAVPTSGSDCLICSSRRLTSMSYSTSTSCSCNIESLSPIIRKSDLSSAWRDFGSQCADCSRFSLDTFIALLHSSHPSMDYRYVAVAALATTVVIAYLWLANYAMMRPLPEALRHAQEPWTNEEMLEVYKEAQKSQVDVKPFLPPKKSRRYVVVGGSGMYCLIMDDFTPFLTARWWDALCQEIYAFATTQL